MESVDGGLVTDGRLGFGTRIEPLPGALVVSGDTLARVSDARPAPAPDAWRGLIGEYGRDYNTLYILEHRGRLHALIEWFFRYPLQQVEGDTVNEEENQLVRMMAIVLVVLAILYGVVMVKRRKQAEQDKIPKE